MDDTTTQLPVSDESTITLEKSWESEDGTVTVHTERNMPTAETHAEFVARHRADVAAMMKLCPPVE